MASTNNDQENVLLPSDEESPSAPPPPRGRLPIKALLAVGLCLAAAGLAGAVVMGRQADRAPPMIKHPSADLVSLGWEKYLSEECNDALEALEKEADRTSRKHETMNKTDVVHCRANEQACLVDFVGKSTKKVCDNPSDCLFEWTMWKCFPNACKEENIRNGMQENQRDQISKSTGIEYRSLTVDCGEKHLGSDKSDGIQLSCSSFSFLALVSLIFIARI